MPPLVFEDAAKNFDSRRGRKAALAGVSFSAGAGEILSVTGPNGSGKTTLLKLAASYLLPDSGSVLVGGLDTRAGLARGLCGYSSGDERSFYWRLTGRQNLEFFAELRGLDGAAAVRESGELFDALGLGAAELGARFDSLSSGAKRKFSLARAMLHRPAVAVLDEPFSNLDAASAAGLSAWLRRAAGSGALVLFSTHSPGTELPEARRLALDSGRLA